MKRDGKCSFITKKNIIMIVSIIIAFLSWPKYKWKKEWKKSWNRWKDSIKNKEKNFMTIFKFIFIAIIIFILPAIAYHILSLVKTKKNRENIKQPFQEKKNNITESFSQQWANLYRQKGELEQKMVTLVSGGSGMVALRDKLQNITESDNDIELCCESFLNKQKQLKKYYELYCDIMKKAELLPDEAGDRFAPLRNEKLYQELLEYSHK